VTLPAFAAECRRLLHGARSCRSILPACRALSSNPAGRRCYCRSDIRTDGRTLDRYIDSASHTMPAAPIIILARENFVIWSEVLYRTSDYGFADFPRQKWRFLGSTLCILTYVPSTLNLIFKCLKALPFSGCRIIRYASECMTVERPWRVVGRSSRLSACQWHLWYPGFFFRRHRTGKCCRQEMLDQTRWRSV